MYHIINSRSKTKPFSLINVGDNGEPINSHLLKTKQACFKNVSAVINGLFGCGATVLSMVYFFVQDDTLETPIVYTVYADGKKEIQPDEIPEPKYIPGRNPKRKKK